MEESDRAPRIPVPENVRGLLCAIAYGWTPAPMALGRIQQLRYCGEDLSEYAEEISLHGERLKVSVKSPFGQLREFASNSEFEGVLANGTRFKGDMILDFNQREHFSPTSAHTTLRMEAGQWTILDSDSPSLWIGRVDGMSKLEFSGNMSIERMTPNGLRLGRTRHFFLSGAYDYFFVQSRVDAEPIWHLVIDTRGAGMPTALVWGRDFRALQFVLGRQMQIAALLGITNDKRTVACASGNKWGHLEESAFPPVPIQRNNDSWIQESWVALFFERLSAAWRNRPESDNAFGVALDMYLDAMKHHLDFDYMRLQIALEAFAYWLLQHDSKEEPKLVKERKAWEKWVKKNKEEIHALASEGFEETLYMNVKNGWRLPSGKVIPTAFEKFGLPLTEEMRRELHGRNVIVHQGLMAPAGYDVERDLRRIGLVRTMLVALVAKASGYGGAINGWETGPLGYRLEPPQDWWSVSNEDRALARRTFFAEELAPD